MLKPPMPNVAGMTDTLDFVKNLWGSMNVPGVTGVAGPSLSLDELDKKISDLKAVESWLNLNTNMLRATIQAMEVQRGTIATLKSMSESMAQAMGQAGAAPATGQPAPTPAGGEQAPEALAAAMPAAVAWWNLLQEQFKQAVASTMPPATAAPGAEPEAATPPAAKAPPAKPRPGGSKGEKS